MRLVWVFGLILWSVGCCALAQAVPAGDRLVITSPQALESVAGAESVTVRWQSDLVLGPEYSLVYSSDGENYSEEIASKLTSQEYIWSIGSRKDLVGWIKVKAYWRGYLLAEDTVQISFVPRDAVIVSKADQRVFHFAGGRLTNVFTCSTALPQYDLKEGVYKVYLRQKMHWSREYEVPMPHSLFFHDGYALHATRVVRLLGRPASHGCIRLRPRDAETLYNQVKVGTPVIVLPKTRQCLFLQEVFKPRQTQPKNTVTASR